MEVPYSPRAPVGSTPQNCIQSVNANRSGFHIQGENSHVWVTSIPWYIQVVKQQ